MRDNTQCLSIAGVRLGSSAAGIRYQGRDDLVVIEISPGSAVAAVFTRNRFFAAPVAVSREHLAIEAPRYLLINAGNANAGTGQAGIAAARSCCQAVAERTGCAISAVLPFSTGVIGAALPVDRIVAGLPAAFTDLSDSGWQKAARAIMTTDTVPKTVSREFAVAGHRYSVTGIAKGAGMIRPDMATLLGFIATDAPLSGAAVQRCLASAVNQSFHRITVDGDTSTNDSIVLIATGAAAVQEQSDGQIYDAASSAVADVCTELAQMIIRDAEGATKFITIEVMDGASEHDCLEVAYTIAHSPLVKTAAFASDPNWGRILAAIGRAPIDRLDIRCVDLSIGDLRILTQGEPDPAYTEARGKAAMSDRDIVLRVGLGTGSAHARVWTSDLSTEYVRINAEYRT